MKTQSLLIASVAAGFTLLTACEKAEESAKDAAVTAPQPAVESAAQITGETPDANTVVETQVAPTGEGMATDTETPVEETAVQVDQVNPAQLQSITEKANEVIEDAKAKAGQMATEPQDATKVDGTQAEDSVNKAVEDVKSKAASLIDSTTEAAKNAGTAIDKQTGAASLTDSATEAVKNAETSIDKQAEETKTGVQGTLDALSK